MITKRLAPPQARRNNDKAASRGLGRGTAICRGVIPAGGGYCLQKLLPAQENDQNADIRRGDAADAAGLADIGGADAAQLFDSLQP